MGQVTLSSQFFIERAQAEMKAICETRQYLHQNPELSFQEFNTARYITSFLDEQGIQYTDGVAGTGIVALIDGKSNGPVVLLRADMDALPITEANNVPYKSLNNGVMHACGHDVHTTCLLYAAKILNETKDYWSGTVKLMFQPGEEVLPGGASIMIEEGVLNNPKVDRAIALHVFPSMEAGYLGFREGMYMASTDELYITVNGKGGHAAMPSEYINPILVASEILLEINGKFMLQDRGNQINMNNIPTVVAFGKFIAQGATNVIPDKVLIEGTMRTMDEQWRKEIQATIHDIIQKVALKYNAQAQLEIKHGYPCVINNPQYTAQCRMHAVDLIGATHVQELPIRMTAEDFAFITQKVPSCFYRLGTGNVKKGIVSGVHTATFDIDEQALPIGVASMAYLAFKTLGAI